MALNRLKNLTPRPVLMLVIFLVLGSIFAFLLTYVRYPSFYDVDFWQNAVSNFIATFLGLFFGIPIAIWISDVQQEASNRDEYLEAKRRKQKILSLISKELSYDYDLFA